jgi:hypothetical protein
MDSTMCNVFEASHEQGTYGLASGDGHHLLSRESLDKGRMGLAKGVTISDLATDMSLGESSQGKYLKWFIVPNFTNRKRLQPYTRSA